MNWAYGVTAVPIRASNLLKRTLVSLAAAGFDKPHLFIDGDDDPRRWEFNATVRFPLIRTYGNWFLTLAELRVRNPSADRYAIFQDDFVTYRNLRAYLDSCEYKPKTYWNLLTFPANQALAKTEGWYRSNQMGRGAVALVFDAGTVDALLTSLHMIDRPKDPVRGWRAVDGGVVTALKSIGWTELVHNPTLVYHTGTISSMGNKPHSSAITFKGETFDACDLVGRGSHSVARRKRAHR